MHPMVPLGDETQVEDRLVHLKIVLILTQDWSTVCVKRTIGLEIVWDTPDELLGDVGHMESLFFMFGDSVSVGAR